MSNKTCVTNQGQAWDQASLVRLGTEKQMAELLQANAGEMDTLLFAGQVELAIPQSMKTAIKSLPPWERF